MCQVWSISVKTYHQTRSVPLQDFCFPSLCPESGCSSCLHMFCDACPSGPRMCSATCSLIKWSSSTLSRKLLQQAGKRSSERKVPLTCVARAHPARQQEVLSSSIEQMYILGFTETKQTLLQRGGSTAGCGAHTAQSQGACMLTQATDHTSEYGKSSSSNAARGAKRTLCAGIRVSIAHSWVTTADKEDPQRTCETAR